MRKGIKGEKAEHAVDQILAEFQEEEQTYGPIARAIMEGLKWLSFGVLSASWLALGTPFWIWLMFRAWTSCVIGNLFRQLAGSNVSANKELLQHAIPFWFSGFATAKNIAFGEVEPHSHPVDMPWRRLLIDSIFTLAFWAITFLGVFS